MPTSPPSLGSRLPHLLETSAPNIIPILSSSSAFPSTHPFHEQARVLSLKTRRLSFLWLFLSFLLLPHYGKSSFKGLSTLFSHHFTPYSPFYLCVLSHAWFFATPWTVARQAPLSMGFSRQEYWSGVPFPSPEDLPDP